VPTAAAVTLGQVPWIGLHSVVEGPAAVALAAGSATTVLPCRSGSAGTRQAQSPGAYGGGVPCGFGWAVPAGLVGWSEPGDQATGGDSG
jgi:hypothetical protein